MINERLVAGHTGYAALYPQNTMLAFEKAIEAGADFIETDVMLSSDGVWVLIHASELSTRTTGVGITNEQPWSYIKTLDVKWYNETYYGREDNKVPSLEQLFDLVRGTDVRIELDLKQWQANPYQNPNNRQSEMTSLVDFVTQQGMLEQCLFLSMENVTNDIKTMFPYIQTGTYYYGVPTSDYAHALQNTIQYNHNVVYWWEGTYDEYPNTYATKQMVDAFHNIGVPFGITTIYKDTYYQVKVYETMGVNRFLVDDVAEAVRALTDGVDLGIVIPEPEEPDDPYEPPEPSSFVSKEDVFYELEAYDVFINSGGDIKQVNVYYGNE